MVFLDSYTCYFAQHCEIQQIFYKYSLPGAHSALSYALSISAVVALTYTGCYDSCVYTYQGTLCESP